MKLSDFNYYLPKELIAKTQMNPRDHSRLLVLDKKNGKSNHHTFYEIIDFLNEGDLLVLNESKVFSARLLGKRKDTGGKIEILLDHQLKDGTWEVIGKNLKINSTIIFDNNFNAKVISRDENIFIIQFNLNGYKLWQAIEKVGHVPLPPYIDKEENESDKKNYQTVYAKNIGSVAAPTAGLHFTKELLKKIERKGVGLTKLTLHVGMGTWSSIKTKEIEDHKIHTEFFEVPKKTIENILQTKKNGGRVIAVGTTTTRVLEHLFTTNYKLLATNYIGETDIYIYPGYKFKTIDGLITNFHLPASSLLLLVSAFAGKEEIKKAYQEAIKQKYRFYSYGDAMLIL